MEGWRERSHLEVELELQKDVIIVENVLGLRIVELSVTSHCTGKMNG